MDPATAKALLSAFGGTPQQPTATTQGSAQPDLRTMTEQQYAFTSAERAKEAAAADPNIAKGWTIENWAHEYSAAAETHRKFTEGLQQEESKTQYQRSLLDDKEQESFENLVNGWKGLQQVSDAWDQTAYHNPTFGHGRGAGVANFVQQFENDPYYRNFQGVTHMMRPIINQSILQEGKAQAGEKANVQGFENNFPNFYDTPESKEASLDVMRRMVASRLTSSFEKFATAGRTQPIADMMKDPTVQQILGWSAQDQAKQATQRTVGGPIMSGLPADQRSILINGSNTGTGIPAPNSSPVLRAPQNTDANGLDFDARANKGLATQAAVGQAVGNAAGTLGDWWQKIFPGTSLPASQQLPGR